MPRRLSPRERQVVRAIAAGRTTKEIATQLGIAASTVDWHVANALGKLQAANRAEGVAVALRRGELSPAPADRLRDAARSTAGRWRTVAAAVVVAASVPFLVAGDVGPPRSPVDVTPAPRIEIAPAATSTPRATSSASSTASAVPDTTPQPTAAPAITSPAAPRGSPVPLVPAASGVPLPATSASATIPIAAPTASLAPALSPAVSPLTSTPPLATGGLPTLQPLPLPTASAFPPAPALPSLPSASPLPSLP